MHAQTRTHTHAHTHTECRRTTGKLLFCFVFRIKSIHIYWLNYPLQVYNIHLRIQYNHSLCHYVCVCVCARVCTCVCMCVCVYLGLCDGEWNAVCGFCYLQSATWALNSKHLVSWHTYKRSIKIHPSVTIGLGNYLILHIASFSNVKWSHREFCPVP